jgi:hypothetical protein
MPKRVNQRIAKTKGRKKKKKKPTWTLEFWARFQNSDVGRGSGRSWTLVFFTAKYMNNSMLQRSKYGGKRSSAERMSLQKKKKKEWL